MGFRGGFRVFGNVWDLAWGLIWVDGCRAWAVSFRALGALALNLEPWALNPTTAATDPNPKPQTLNPKP